MKLIDAEKAVAAVEDKLREHGFDHAANLAITAIRAMPVAEEVVVAEGVYESRGQFVVLNGTVMVALSGLRSDLLMPLDGHRVQVIVRKVGL